jgi:hypothetical protein
MGELSLPIKHTENLKFLIITTSGVEKRYYLPNHMMFAALVVLTLQSLCQQRRKFNFTQSETVILYASQTFKLEPNVGELRTHKKHLFISRHISGNRF